LSVTLDGVWDREMYVFGACRVAAEDISWTTGCVDGPVGRRRRGGPPVR